MNKITTEIIKEMKKQRRKITMLTAYDYITAKFEDEIGIDIILVGDSLGMVIHVDSTTLNVTLQDIAYHVKAVSKGVKKALIIADMPVNTYNTCQDALNNARTLLNAGADAVKIEGNKPEIVKCLLENNIDIMGHIGLTPQTITTFKVQGKDEESKERLIKEAISLEEAGCFAIVLECIPIDLAKKITEKTRVPTIGIGAGKYCDGQVLVIHDLLGLFEDFKPKFVKKYIQLAPVIKQAIQEYKTEVVNNNFPSEEYSYR